MLSALYTVPILLNSFSSLFFPKLPIFQLSEQEVVGRWAAQQEKELKLLGRTDGRKLFSNLTRGNHYLVQAEGYLNNSGSGQTSEMALIWNRTLPGGSVSVGMIRSFVSDILKNDLFCQQINSGQTSCCFVLNM